MERTSPVYRVAVGLVSALLPFVGHKTPKLSAGIAARRDLIARMRAWAAAHRDPARPLLWMHASSVGEGLQAEAVLDLLRQAHPEWQIVFTHFSPSAYALARRLPVDYADYLPLDRTADVLAALDALTPSALVFCKVDLWPELATRASARGVAVGIIAGTVSPVSRRTHWPARALLRPGYAVVDRAGAISADDADRLVRLGVPREKIEVTGDPRFDSALQRVSQNPADDPLLDLGKGGATLVAGSTWPEDERVLLPAFAAVRAARSDVRLIVVPHEPTLAHLDELDALAARTGLEAPRRLSASDGTERFIVVDQVGVLARLYPAAQIGYVGGGFGTAGLHSVLEPAACGVPVLFGPSWQASREAGILLAHRGAIVISEDFPDWLDLDRGTTFGGASPLAAIWLALLRNPAHARDAGHRALECVEAGLGAAARSAGLVEALMQRVAIARR